MPARTTAVGAVLSLPVHRFWVYTESCAEPCILPVLVGWPVLTVAVCAGGWLGCRLLGVPRPGAVAASGLALAGSWYYLAGGVVQQGRYSLDNPPPPLPVLVLIGGGAFGVAAAVALRMRRAALVGTAVVAALAGAALLIEPLVRGTAG